MTELKIIPALTDVQLQQIADLAKPIWEEHFTPILGPAQVAYMVDRFQSYPALKAQAEEGYAYYLLNYDGQNVGYSGIHIEDKALFLSKIYLQKAYRGKDISRQVMNFYTELCQTQGLDKIWLTCNRHNTGSIGAYQHMGFVTVRTQAADIGSGYVMDDYIMEKQITHS